MLFCEPYRSKEYPQSQRPDKYKMYSRPPYITITNVCNLTCGGCSQLCGTFTKEKLWFITLPQLETNIKVMAKYINKNIWIFGGEPTLHPQFDEIKELLYSFNDCQFTIFTNGRLHKKEDVKLVDNPSQIGGRIKDKNNVEFLIDFKQEYGKDGHPNKMFNPTLIAPIDKIKIKSKDYYWREAKKHCICWNQCGTTIYNDKAYLCEVAPAIDKLAGTDHGWDVKEGENPFDKTDEEIAEQARNFCYRCAAGYSHDKHIIPDQDIREKYFVSVENFQLIDKSKKHQFKES